MKTLAMVLLAALAASAGPDPFDPSSGDFLEIDLDSLETAAGTAYHAGDHARAASLYLELLSHDARNSRNIYNLACCYGLLGMDTLAAVTLERAVTAGFTDMGFAGMDPDFEAVRGSGFFSAVFDSLVEEARQRELAGGRVMMIETGCLVPVRLFLPDVQVPGRPLKLVVALHGYGDSAERFAGLWREFESPWFAMAVPESPYAMNGGSSPGYSWAGGAWGDSASRTRSWDLAVDQVMRVVDAVSEEIAVSEVYLLGFSQGCALAYDAGLSNHDRVEGILCFGGRLDLERNGPELLHEARNLRVFICHGTMDGMVDYSCGEGARDTLSSLGYDVTFRRFDGGHTIPEHVLPEVEAWLRM
ncbi:hypothetical protein GX411_05225 [Candidatus Fermentibacteria bacterium]|nr:hypothetical protein [Candidatus Fermentibacteria bacterium]